MDNVLHKIETDKELSQEEALEIINTSDLPSLLQAATTVRQQKFGNKVQLCSILNAKCGACSEDCIFCAQSCHYATSIQTHPLLPPEKIVSTYEEACKLPISRFGIVTSGRRLGEHDVNKICQAVQSRPGSGVRWCASLGCLKPHQLQQLRTAGITRYHHNLETSKSHFQNICSTHSYDDRVATVLAAKEVGLEICCGGIFGLGETLEQRVELAFAIRDLGVDSIPLNFLCPIPNTPAAQLPPLSSEDVLKTIVLFRLVCRHSEIKICGGRERYLGDKEHLIFAAGATSMMIGGYLTLKGRDIEDDLLLLRKAQMEV